MVETGKGSIKLIGMHQFWLQAEETAILLYDQKDWVSIATAEASAAAVEAPIVGLSGAARTATHLAMAAGACLIGAHEAGAMTMLVPPASWKKAVVGHGHATKQDVIDACAAGVPGFDTSWVWEQAHRPKATNKDKQSLSDIADAVCLALYCAGASLVSDSTVG